MKHENQFGLRPTLKDGIVKFDLVDKTTKDVIESKEFDFNQLPPEVQEHLGLYGLRAMLSDRTSGVPMGSGKLVVMNEYFQLFLAGKLSKDRKVGTSVVPAWVEALARSKDATIPDVQLSLKALTEEQRKQIQNSSQLAPLIASVEAERKARSDAPISFDDMIN